ncbi:MAG: T7SS effector LXG polymorphic toxin [Ruminococcus bromii]|nr:T7SS effector LXG polymorphic toxin [Ruminococcus bromii]
MGYKVDFDALDTLYYSINNKAVEWSEALGGVHESVNNLAASDCITGAGAENIKSYLSEVHSMVIGLLGRIISAHADNCLLYKRAYQDNIDTSVHAVILEDELTDIIGDLHVYQNQTYSVDCQIRSALTSISDIFYNQSYRGYSTVDDDFETTKNKVKTLDKDIHSLENSHLNSDFTNTEALLEKLTAYLNTQLSKPKSYKTEFSLEQAQKDPTLQEIALAYKALSEESDAKRTALKTAGENEQARVEILQKEYEERQQTATIINWVVTGLCIVGSIAITVATCGAASPLAVALTVGAVSAGSGVIMAGTQSITSQWVETGDLSKTDWLDVGKCSLIAGVTGFVTGFVSAGVGGVVTSKLASAAVTAPLINSSSTVTRVATHVVIGSASEVASGTVSRFAGGIISTGDVDESLKQAFDPKNILFDAALGGAMSGVQGLKKPQQSYADLMSPEDAAKYRQFLEHGSTSGFTSPELKAFDKVDEALLMKRIDYDKVLTARKSAITNSDGTISGVQGLKKPQHNSVISNTDGTISGVQEINKPRQYSGDLMPPEDAARYSEHWRQLGIGSDETWSAFKEHYPNGTIDDYLDIVKNESPWPPGYTPEEIVLEPGDSFEMALSKNQSPNTPGRFATTSGSITDKKYVRTDLAVKEKWKSDIDKVVGYQIKDGKRISALSGPVGPQIDLESNTFLAGGADQIHIPLDRDVNMMDYLEIKDIRNIR